MGSFSIRAIVIGVITFLCLSEVALYSTAFLTTDINKESEPNGGTIFLALFLSDFLVTAIAAFVAAYAAKRLYVEHALAIAVAAILFRLVVVDTATFGLLSILSLLTTLAAAYAAGFLCMRWTSSSVTQEETGAIVKEEEISGKMAKEEVSDNKYPQANAWYAWECALIGFLSKISFTVYWYFTTRADISGSEFYMFAVIILITESTLSYYDGKIKLIGPTLLGLLAAEFLVMIFTIIAPDVSPVSYQITSPLLTTLIYTVMLAPVSVVGGMVGKLMGRFYGGKESQEDNEQLLPWPLAIGFFLAAATPASHSLEKVIKDHIVRNNVIEITRAQFEYFNEHPEEGFSCDLAKITGRDSKQKHDTFGASYFINYHWGYRYELWCEPEARPNNRFFIIAIPYSPSTSSDAVYCSDESGTVRMATASQPYSTHRCRNSKTVIEKIADKLEAVRSDDALDAGREASEGRVISNGNNSQDQKKQVSQKLISNELLARMEVSKPPYLYASWAHVVPTLDGVIGDGEWDDASGGQYSRKNYLGRSYDAICMVKNDDEYLYIAVIVKNNDYVVKRLPDTLRITFKRKPIAAEATNHEYGFDVINIPSDGHPSDGYYSSILPKDGGALGFDVNDGGANDVDASVSHSNPVDGGIGDYVFEMRHPWHGDDKIHDIWLSEGDTVEFNFTFFDITRKYYYQPKFPEGYAKIKIMSKPDGSASISSDNNSSNSNAALSSLHERNRSPEKKCEISTNDSAWRRDGVYGRFNKLDGMLVAKKTGDPALPFAFNHDTSYVISINQGIPDVSNRRESLAKLLVTNNEQHVTDRILFTSFGDACIDSIKITIGSRVPVKVVQAVVRVFSQDLTLPITIDLNPDENKYGSVAQIIYVGGLRKPDKSPISKETIDTLLRKDISQKEFIRVVSELK